MQLNQTLVPGKKRPVKVLQYGEGNFLRAFIDYMIDVANEKGVTDMSVAVVKPIPFGSLERFAAQDNRYTVYLRGVENGQTITQHRAVSCIDRVIDPFIQTAEYESFAASEELRFIVSNTTEAGIVFSQGDTYNASPLPATYPGKLTKLLHQRFLHFKGAADKGLILLPCELIEKNGETLKKCVFQYIDLWDLGQDFAAWVEKTCFFCNTLVDRIVTGYPKDEAPAICKELGYEDELLDTCEPFLFWVIGKNGCPDFSAELPLDKAGFQVLFCDDYTPYRDRKVRILNGAHTSTVLGAFLAGKDYVIECMEDEAVKGFMSKCLFDEIMPTLTLPKEEIEAFAAATLERFANPFIKHALLSIALNSTSKWKARILPSVLDYLRQFGKAPRALAFSLAALLCFYRGSGEPFAGTRNGQPYPIQDDEAALAFFREHQSVPLSQVAQDYIAIPAFCGQELPQYPCFTQAVQESLALIEKVGMYQAMQDICK